MFRQLRSGVARKTDTLVSKMFTLCLHHTTTYNRASFLLKHSSTFICCSRRMTYCRWTDGFSILRRILCQYFAVLLTLLYIPVSLAGRLMHQIWQLYDYTSIVIFFIEKTIYYGCKMINFKKLC